MSGLEYRLQEIYSAHAPPVVKPGQEHTIEAAEARRESLRRETAEIVSEVKHLQTKITEETEHRLARETPMTPLTNKPKKARIIRVGLAVAILALLPHFATSTDFSDGLRLGPSYLDNDPASASIILGQGNRDLAPNTMAIGNANYLGGSSVGHGSIAAGASNVFYGVRNYAFGYSNTITAGTAMAIGAGSPGAYYLNQPKNPSDPIVALDLAVPFPENPVEGNDDPLPPSGDGEKSNPYIADVTAAVGEIYDLDGPGLGVYQDWGQVGNQYDYSETVNFRDFGRVQLFDGSRVPGTFWFRISDYIPWHIAIKAKFFGPSPSWHNDGSHSGLGYSPDP